MRARYLNVCVTAGLAALAAVSVRFSWQAIDADYVWLAITWGALALIAMVNALLALADRIRRLGAAWLCVGAVVLLGATHLVQGNYVFAMASLLIALGGLVRIQLHAHLREAKRRFKSGNRG